MELTLKKARKLEGKIQSAMNELQLETSVEVRAKSTNPVADVAAAREQVMKRLGTLSNLNEARYQVRRSIGEVNQKVGICELMANRERLLADLANVVRLLGSPVSSQEEVMDLVDAKRAQLASGQESYRLQVTVSIPCLSKDDSEYLKKQAKLLKDRIEETEDELIQKNAGAKISLSESTVATLRAHALV